MIYGALHDDPQVMGPRYMLMTIIHFNKKAPNNYSIKVFILLKITRLLELETSKGDIIVVEVFQVTPNTES